jgi:hypothetical protein
MNVPFVYRNRKTGLKPRERPSEDDNHSHSHFTARLRGQPSFRDSLAASAKGVATSSPMMAGGAESSSGPMMAGGAESSSGPMMAGGAESSSGPMMAGGAESSDTVI